jgi:hypothetical protein
LESTVALAVLVVPVEGTVEVKGLLGHSRSGTLSEYTFHHQ